MKNTNVWSKIQNNYFPGEGLSDRMSFKLLLRLRRAGDTKNQRKNWRVSKVLSTNYEFNDLAKWLNFPKPYFPLQ